MKKRFISMFMAIIMMTTVFSALTIAETGTQHPFTDVKESEWYNEYVSYVWNYGIFNGTSESNFSPEDNLTRAMFVTVLGRLAGVNPTQFTDRVFDDVEPDAWYGAYVAWASKYGITSGVSETSFAPDSYVTRQQIATFLGRFMNCIGKNVEGTELTYTDKAKIADYAIDGAKVSLTLGLITGDTQNCFRPEDYATRAEAATICARLHKYLMEEAQKEKIEKEEKKDDDDNKYLPAPSDNVVSTKSKVKITVGRPDGVTDENWAKVVLPNLLSVTKGTLISSLPTPTLEGYVFAGWYYDKELEQSIPDTAIVTSRKTIYPKFTETSDKPIETVTYHSVRIGVPASMDDDDISDTAFPPEQMVVSGELVYAMPTPYREGYIFAGWYYDAALATVADVNDTITSNMTIYPRLVPEEEAPILGDGAMNYVSVLEADPGHLVTVKAPDEDTVRDGLSFIGVSDGNVEMAFDVDDNGDGTYTIRPESELKPGKTYQIIAGDRETLATAENPFPTDDEYILFIFEDEVQRKEVRYYNIFVHREEEDNLRIDEGVRFINFDDVSSFGIEEAAGLYTVLMNEDGEVSLVDNCTEGSFVYEGTPALKVGDIVAIHKGEFNEEQRIFEDDEEVAYIEITKVDGNVYQYVSAQVEDVLFLPDVIPIPRDADMDGNTEDDTVTVDSDMLDFTFFENQEILNSDTIVGVDDYIAFYTGALNEEANAEGYARITDITENDNGTVTINYVSCTTEELQASLDTYTVNSVPVNLPESEIRVLENRLVEQAQESGFVQEAAAYAVRNKLGIKEDIEWGGTYAMDADLLENYDIEVDAGNIMVQLEVGTPNVNAEIKTELKKVTQINKGTGLRVAFGVTVPVGLEVVEQFTGTVVESLTIDLYVTFEQEVAFNTKFSVDVQWDNWLFIFWIDEVVVNAKFELGTYTGIGAILTMSTAKYYDKTYLWTELVKGEDGSKIFSSASSIATKLNEQLKGGDLTFFDELTENGESLADRYSEMLQREVDYFDILALPLFYSKGYLDPKTHLVNYILEIELVFAAKLNVSMGISFENLNVKEYNFTLRIFDGSASSNVVDKQTPYTNFNFFIMGNLGVRAGLAVTFTVGLISTKLDNIGIHVEVGPYLELYGFYYYHYDKVGNNSPNIQSAGAVYVEIGIYMAIDFFAGVFVDLLSVEVHLLDESWPLWSTKNQWYPIRAEIPESDVVEYNGEDFAISDSYFKLREFNIVTGEWRTSKSSIKDYEEWIVPDSGLAESGDTDKITYNAKKGRFEVKPDYTDMELSASFDFKYKNSNPLLGPVTKTINITWKKTEPMQPILYRTGNTSSCLQHNGTEWEWITVKQVDDSRTIMKVAGDKLSAIPNHDLPWAGFDFVGWYIDCPELPEYHGKMLHEVDYLEDVIMPNCSIALDPVHTPRNDTPYTIRHKVRSANGDGYEVILEERQQGRTNSFIKEFNFLDKTEPGLRLDISKYPIVDILDIDYQGNPMKYIVYHHISGKGDTIVDLYYERAEYQVALHANNPFIKLKTNLDENIYRFMKYGAEIPDPGYAEALKGVCAFKGWSTTPDGPVEYTELPEVSIPEGSTLHYYAVWEYPEVECEIRHYAYDPATRGYSDTPAYVEKCSLPIGTKLTTGEFATDNSAIPDGQYANKIDGFYGDNLSEPITMPYLNMEAVNSKAVINVYYYASYRQIVFGTDVEYYHYASEVTVPEGPEKIGYDFNGWRSSLGMGKMIYQPDSTFDALHSDYLTPTYVPSESTPYTVNHHYEKIDKGEYDEPVVENHTGTTDSDVSPDVLEKTGYTSPAVQTVQVEADGSTTVDYYYKRTVYDVKIDADGGTVRGQYVSSYRYGVPFELFTTTYAVSKTGKIFLGWYLSTDESKTILDDNYIYSEEILNSCDDLTFVAKYEDMPIEYHVQHYLEQLDGSYELQQTDKLTDVLGGTVTAEAADFTGFEADTDNEENITSGTITSVDTPVVLKLYYNRKSFTATWTDYDGTELTSADFRYGEDITLPEGTPDPERTDYRFDGWTDFGTMPAQNKTFSAEEYGLWTSLAGPYDLVIDLGGDSMRYKDYGEILTYEVDDITESVEYREPLASYLENEAITEFLAAEYPGYTFDGWYDEDGNLYDADSTMPAGNLKLTAKWIPVQVKLTLFNGSAYSNWGGTPSGEPVTVICSYGEIIDIPEHGFICEGYFISGWKVGEGDGGPGQGAVISDKLVLLNGYYEESITEEGMTPAGELYIFPVWASESRKFTVSFNGNGGVGSMPDQYIDASYGNYTAINFNRFTRDGYRFIGWTETQTYDPETSWMMRDGETYTPDPSMTSTTLYAQWEAIN